MKQLDCTLICSFQFVFAFVVLLDLLLHTKALSDYLQDDVDSVSAVDMVQSLISLIKDKRSDNCLDYFAKAQSKCHEFQITGVSTSEMQANIFKDRWYSSYTAPPSDIPGSI